MEFPKDPQVRYRALRTAVLVFLGGFLFFGYNIRPAAIREFCHSYAEVNAANLFKQRASLRECDMEMKKQAEQGWYLRADYESAYEQCLRSKGLRE